MLCLALLEVRMDKDVIICLQYNVNHTLMLLMMDSSKMTTPQFQHDLCHERRLMAMSRRPDVIGYEATSDEVL